MGTNLMSNLVGTKSTFKGNAHKIAFSGLSFVHIKWAFRRNGCQGVEEVNYHINEIFPVRVAFLTRMDIQCPFTERERERERERVKGIQVCLNEGPRPSQRVDKSEKVKLFWKFLKVLTLKLLGKFQLNLAQSTLG